MKRIQYLDALKGFCILLVVFCHYPILPEKSFIGNIIMTLAWAAVPCFMMVTGGLMHHSKAFSWRKHAKRLVETYIKIVFWKAVYLAAYSIVSKLSFSCAAIVQYLFFFGDLQGVNVSVSWYMNAYLLVMFLYPVTYYLHKHDEKLLGYLTLLTFFAGIILPSLNWIVNTIRSKAGLSEFAVTGVNTVMPFVQWANMIFFFLLGAYLFDRRDELTLRLKKIWTPVVLIIIGGVCLMLIKKLDAGTFLWRGIYLSNGYIHLATVVMSFGLYELFSMLPDNSVSKWVGNIWGKNTMGIYYLHFLILGILNITVFTTVHIPASAMMNILKALILASGCSAVTFVCRRIPVLKMFFQ